MVPLARRNLLAEKVRLMMSIAGVAFAVLLILVVLSLYRGWGGASSFFTDFPGDVWLVQEGTNDPFRSTSLLPSDREDELGSVPGVLGAMPVHARRIGVADTGDDVSVLFMSFGTAGGPQRPIGAVDPSMRHFFPSRGRVVIDSVLADTLGVDVGDTLDVLGTPVEVETVTSGGNPLFAMAFLHPDDGAELLRADGFVNFYLLMLAPDAGREAAHAAAALVDRSVPRTGMEFADAVSAEVDRGFLPVVGALVAIGYTIGGAVVALTAYTSTIEKARDFAVLKAVGASAPFVSRVVIKQSFIVATLGSVVGVVAAVVVATLVRQRVPEFVTDLQTTDVATVSVTILLVALLSAYIPMRRINRIDPAMVFRA